MSQFQYRAVGPGGAVTTGRVEATDRVHALRLVRAQGVSPVEVTAAGDKAAAAPPKPNGATRKAVAKLIGELAVLLGAGLSLDRALALALDNIEHAATRAEVGELLRTVSYDECTRLAQIAVGAGEAQAAKAAVRAELPQLADLGL